MKLLIFDFDGVLADTFADMIQFAQEACDELGVDHTVISTDISDLEEMSFATFGKACKVPEELIGEFVGRCTRKFAEKPKPPPIFEEMQEVIRELAKGNILTIVTGNTAENVNTFLQHHKLQDCFQMLYGVDMPGSKAEKILAVKHQFDANDDVEFFIGDSLSDIRAARNANVMSVAVGWGHQKLGLLLEGKPDLIVHSPLELLDVLSQNAPTV